MAFVGQKTNNLMHVYAMALITGHDQVERMEIKRDTQTKRRERERTSDPFMSAYIYIADNKRIKRKREKYWNSFKI